MATGNNGSGKTPRPDRLVVAPPELVVAPRWYRIGFCELDEGVTGVVQSFSDSDVQVDITHRPYDEVLTEMMAVLGDLIRRLSQEEKQYGKRD